MKQMKRALLLTCLTVVALSIIACNDLNTQQAYNALGAVQPTFKTAVINFGDIKQKEATSKKLEISNVGGDYTFNDYYFSGDETVFVVTNDCTASSGTSLTVQAGGCSIDITFTPTAPTAEEYKAFLSLGGETVYIAALGMGVNGEKFVLPAISAETLIFNPTEPLETSPAQTIKISYSSDRHYLAEKFEITGENAKLFKVEVDQTSTGCQLTNKGLSVNKDGCVLNFTFTPAVDSPATAKAKLAFATKEITLKGSTSAVPKLSVSAVAFGKIENNKTKTESIKITYSGDEDYKSKFVLTNDANNAFAIDKKIGNCIVDADTDSITVKTGECDLVVTFAPKVDDTTFSGSLTLDGRYTVQISGTTAIAPKVTVAPDLNFKAQAEKKSAKKVIATIKPISSKPYDDTSFNIGGVNADLFTITSVDGNCVIANSKLNIAGTGDCTIEAEYHPIVNTQASATSILTIVDVKINLTGVTTPFAYVEKDTKIEFKDVKGNLVTPEQRAIVIRYDSNAELSSTVNYSIAGANLDSFEVRKGDCSELDSTAKSITVARGGCTIFIAFDPKNNANNTYTAELTIGDTKLPITANVLAAPKVTTSVVKFGTTQAGKVYTLGVNITYTGSDEKTFPVEIKKASTGNIFSVAVKSTDKCSYADTQLTLLADKKECDLTVTFAPLEDNKLYTADLDIDGTILKLSGTTVLMPTITPKDSLSLKTAGVSDTKTITFTNSSSIDYIFKNTSITLTDYSEGASDLIKIFAAVAAPNDTFKIEDTNACIIGSDMKVAAGQTCQLNVTFTPKETGKKYTANITVVGKQYQLIGNSGTVPTHTAQPSNEITFNTDKGDEDYVLLKFTGGTIDYTYTGYNLIGDAGFTVTEDGSKCINGGTLTVSAESKCYLGITFKPAEFDKKYLATLKLTDTKGAQQDITLTGTTNAEKLPAPDKDKLVIESKVNETGKAVITVKNEMKYLSTVIYSFTNDDKIFSVDERCEKNETGKIVLIRGESCSLTVNFKPTADMPYENMITINGKAVALTGTVIK